MTKTTKVVIVLAAIVVFSMAACKGKGGESSGLSGNEIDSFLADYEKFVNDYSTAMQKALTGDFSAAADLENYTPIFQDWQKRLENFTDSDFTPEQARKITELTDKLTASLGL